MPRARSDRPWLDIERNGFYTAYWYDPSLQRIRSRSLGTRDALEAAARFQAFVSEAQAIYAPVAEAVAPTSPAAVTVGQVLDAYEREHVNVKVIDKDRARDALANLRAFFGGLPVAAITFAKSREYTLARELGQVGGKGRRGTDPMPGSPATSRRELTVLVAAVNHALRHGHVTDAGLRRDARGRLVLVDLPPDSRPVDRWLTHAEMAALRAACGATGRLRQFVEIAYYTASRREAVETLTWFQVDLERGRIHLAKANEPQTKKRRPVVPIDPQLRPWLEQARKDNGKTEHVLGAPTPLYRPFMAAAARAGLGPDVTPHVLRHTRATHLLQAGKSLFAVANLLGDTTSTVERVYGSHSAEFMAEVLDGPRGAPGETPNSVEKA